MRLSREEESQSPVNSSEDTVWEDQLGSAAISSQIESNEVASGIIPIISSLSVSIRLGNDILIETLSFLPRRYLYLALVSRRWLRLYRHVNEKRETCFDAAVEPIQSFMWSRVESLDRPTRIANIAAINGQLDVLQPAVRVGHEVNDWTCSRAAACGAIAPSYNGCPSKVVIGMNTQLQALLSENRWLRLRGCPWDESACEGAARPGNAAVVKGK
jgi:hypothetical protein